MIWVAFDTETTGVDPGSRSVELAAIAFDDDGMVKDVFTSLIHPGMPIPPDATAANGLIYGLAGARWNESFHF